MDYVLKPMESVRKGNRFELNCCVEKFAKKVRSASNLWQFTSAPFHVDGVKWGIEIWDGSSNEESSRTITCNLIRKDQNIPKRFADYMFKYKITLHNEIWERPEERFSFKDKNFYSVDLMRLSDIRDKRKFPSESRLTVKFNLQKLHRKYAMRYYKTFADICIRVAPMDTHNGMSPTVETEKQKLGQRNDDDENVVTSASGDINEMEQVQYDGQASTSMARDYVNNEERYQDCREDDREFQEHDQEYQKHDQEGQETDQKCKEHNRECQVKEGCVEVEQEHETMR